METPQAGLGWRQPHYRELLERRPALGFLEVHSENFFGDGGAALAVLERGRAQYPVSLHGVGLGLGSAAGLDEDHLEQLARLVDRIEPVRVSDHACFARVPQAGGIIHAADLLPLAFDAATLDVLCGNVERVQDRLRRVLLVENLSAYTRLAPLGEALDEPAFFNALTRRTGCRLLLDVNNLVVNALNAGHDEAGAAAAACAWIDAIDRDSVGEIHLAGYCRTPDLVIDDHGSRVHAPVWAVYRHALRRLGTRPTLIEWDTDLPALDVLLDEVRLAQACVADQRAAVLDGQRRLLDAIHAPDPAADRGVRAYRGNAAALAARALAAAHPVLAGLLGDAAFGALARDLWQAHPPVLGDLGCWGGALADFLAGPAGLPDEPVLADLARLEWALHRAGFAADTSAPVHGLALLESHDPAALSLSWTAGAGLLSSRFPIVSVHAAALAGERLPSEDLGSEHAWWWRRGWRVEVVRLDAAQAAFHAALDRGVPLGPALEQVTTLHPHFDFTAWLQTALTSGWLAAVQAVDAQEITT